MAARAQELKRLVKDLLAAHMGEAAVLGALAGYWAASVHEVLNDEGTILLAMAGADAAFLAVTMAAVALMVGLLEGFFGQIIESTPSGLAGFFRPFKLIAWVSAFATVASVGAAIDVDVSEEKIRSALFGLSVALTVWTIFGTVALTYASIRYSVKKRERDTEVALKEAQAALEVSKKTGSAQ
jgi:hypothetical protein